MKSFRFFHPFVPGALCVNADTALDAIKSFVDSHIDPQAGAAYANQLNYEYACDPDGMTALDGDASADDQAARFVALYGIDCAMQVAQAERPEGRTPQDHLVARLGDMALDCGGYEDAGRAIFEVHNEGSLDESLEEFFDFEGYAKAQNEKGDVSLYTSKDGSILVFLT